MPVTLPQAIVPDSDELPPPVAVSVALYVPFYVEPVFERE